jgi:aryl-alcohol dehydrogenase-like predicted oxidoreductase
MQSASPPDPYSVNSTLTPYPGYAIRNNLTPFISMQNHYSLTYREEEREMMPLLKVLILCNHGVGLILLLQHLGVGCIPWSPLARGVLTRPWDDESTRSQSDVCVYSTPLSPSASAEFPPSDESRGPGAMRHLK